MPHEPEIATVPDHAEELRPEGSLRHLFHQNLAGLFRISWNGVILDCNEMFAEMLGMGSPEDLRGLTIQNFYDDPSDRTRALARLEEDSTHPVHEFCLRRLDGSVMWVLAKSSRITGADGSPQVEGTAVDITPRKRATEALLESEARFRSVVQTAGAAIMCLDVDHRITVFNPAAEGVFGRKRDDVLGRDYPGLLPVAVREKVRMDLRRVAAGDAIADFENVVVRPDGRFTVLLWNMQPLADAGGRRHGVVAVGQDITGRQRAEESLLRQTRYLRALTDTDRAILALEKPATIAAAVLPHLDALLPCRGASVVAYDFEAGEARLLGVHGDAGEPIAPTRPLSDRDFGDGRVVVSDTPHARSLAVPLVALGVPIGLLQIHALSGAGPVTSSEIELASHVADRLAVALQNSRLFDGARDARVSLEAVSVRLVDVQEAERRRLARELHDEIGQALTGLKLQLEMQAAGPWLSDGLGRACAITQRLIEQVRNLSLDLRPAMLDDLGLVPALLWHIDRYTSQTGVTVDLCHDGLDARCDQHIETAVYRIVQEALTNVARHAQVQRAVVRVRRTDTDIELEVVDQGEGFETSIVEATPSTGISSMRERATLLGGTLRIRSAPQSGTVVRARLPLDRVPRRQTIPDLLARARTAYERARRRRATRAAAERRHP